MAGDTVLVAAGTYTEPFNMQPGIAVVSQAGPPQTIIDGENVRGPLVLAADQSITATARLEGFTVMRGNSAGIAIVRASPVITNCVIYDNHGGYGGGIVIANAPANVLISHSRILSNTATGDGGGIWLVDGAALTLVHSTVATNTARLWAGGVLGNNAAMLTITDTLFQENRASHGGGVMVSHCPLHLVDSEFYSNTATSGGGIHVRDDSPFEIRNNRAEHNAGSGGGIGIFEGPSGVIVSNTVRYNASASGTGGGISVDGATAVISVNLIISNTAHDIGGGLYLAGYTGTVAYNTIQDNWSAGNGAGVGVRRSSAVTFLHNDVSGNASSGAGGGMGIVDGSTLLGKQNWIADNTGGGLFVADAASTMENNFIVRNALRDNEAQIKIRGNGTFTGANNTVVGTGSFAGIQVDNDAVVLLRNNIVSNNGYGIQRAGAVSPTLDHNVVWDSRIANFQGVTPGPNDLACDPDFADATNGDYHLGICSCAVDAGTNAGAPAIDYDGAARPVDGDGNGTAIVDIGADERLTVTAPLPLAGFTHVTNGLVVTFTNTSSHAVSYQWGFGDGVGTSTAVNPIYTYSTPGTYTVTLTATCSFGCTNIYRDSVELKQFRLYLPLLQRAKS